MRLFDVRSTRQSSGGFSLIELMIALVIGLIIVLGAFQLFVTAKTSFNMVEKVYERQAVLSYLTNVISQEVRIASGPVYPADNGDVVNESSNLLINLSGLAYDPYCGDDGDLQAVEYYAEEGDVWLTYGCSDADNVSRRVASRVNELSFFGDGNPLGSMYIDVKVVFDLLPGESAGSNEFYFRVTSRKVVLDGI